MMPEGGGEARGAALATLRVLIHEGESDPALGAVIARAEGEREAGKLGPWQAANLREIRRRWEQESALPADLVEAASVATSRCEQAWRKLRAANDWASLRPLLEEVVARKREIAAALGTKFGLTPYDALLDGFEPGARAARIEPVFAALRARLPAIIDAIIERQRGETVVAAPGPFPIERQRWLGLELMRRVGFDFAHGRLDVSHHPFCGGVPQDVRITTRYDEKDFARALMGVLHETGHAKYEQNLPRTFVDQPVGAARSMAVHESQSLLQEMQVGRSREFQTFAAPFLREAFPEAAKARPEAFEPQNLFRLQTRVQRSYIRVDADEATYPCHVILRFAIERDLVEGRMRVADLPERWDAESRALLALPTAGNDRDGCMQDVHWPAGLFGYFPTYTLGALAAAQIFAAARSSIRELPAQIARGEFDELNAWLRERIWSQGCLLETDELITRATGKPLDAEAFEAHLRARYLA